jgi:RNA polymerase sigma factor (sigma-70 family)
MGGFLDFVRVAVGPADDPRTDAELLAAFSDRRDATAFAVLVHRYGALVWTVCRRVSGDGHAAEDAFQATFLVLVRKAASVRPRHSVGGWLHRTATNIALKVRVMNQRRTRREVPRSAPAERTVTEPTEPTDPSALAALDEEIARLPDDLRAVVVACELRGVSRREAAARLGIAEGTVSSRLAAARKRLADRLRKRGVSTIGGVTGLLVAGGTAGADAPLRMVASAIAFGAGYGAPSPVVSALVSGEIRTMFLTKLILATVLATFTAAAGLWPLGSSAVPPPLSPLAVPVRAPVPPTLPREGVIVVNSFQPNPPALLLTPEGKEIGTVAVGSAAAPINPGEQPVCPLLSGRLSPDGKRLVAFKLGPIPQGNVGPWTPMHLWLFDLDSKDGPSEPLMKDLRFPSAAWSADGTKLYGSQIDPEKVTDPRDDTKPAPVVSWVYDFKTKKKTALALPPGHGIIDVSPDGQTLLTQLAEPRASQLQSFLVPLGTLKAQPLAKVPFQGMRFSPDGKGVIGSRMGKRGDKPPLTLLWVVSVADGSERTISVPAEAVAVHRACWSPDGKRIAYEWAEELDAPLRPAAPAGNPPAPAVNGPNKVWASRVTVADLDGRNAKTILRREYDQSVQGLDWK